MDDRSSWAAVSELRAQDFEVEVLQSSLPVMVSFGASWSHACQVMEPVLAQTASACVGKARVLRVDADEHPDLSLWYEVQSVPTLLFFLGGRLCGRLVGTATVEAILAKLERVVRPGGEVPPAGAGAPGGAGGRGGPPADP